MLELADFSGAIPTKPFFHCHIEKGLLEFLLIENQSLIENP